MGFLKQRLVSASLFCSICHLRQIVCRCIWLPEEKDGGVCCRKSDSLPAASSTSDLVDTKTHITNLMQLTSPITRLDINQTDLLTTAETEDLPHDHVSSKTGELQTRVRRSTIQQLQRTMKQSSSSLSLVDRKATANRPENLRPQTRVVCTQEQKLFHPVPNKGPPRPHSTTTLKEASQLTFGHSGRIQSWNPKQNRSSQHSVQASPQDSDQGNRVLPLLQIVQPPQLLRAVSKVSTQHPQTLSKQHCCHGRSHHRAS